MDEKRAPSIISLGALNVDFVMELGPDKVGKKRMGRQISINVGGPGSNQSIAAVRSGVPTAIVGRIGNDAFGRQIRDTLQAEHVDCRFLIEMEHVHSGLATIIVEEGHENVFIDFLGSNFKLDRRDIDSCKDAVADSSLVMIHMGPSSMDVSAYMAETANRCHTRVLVTPNVTASVPDALWENVDYLVMNIPQAAALCGLKDESPKTARIAAGMMSERVRGAVVIHMDNYGVLTAENGILTTLDTAASCRIADVSGATDFFTGVFGAELVKGSSVQTAAIKAHRAALRCMEKVGVYESFPSKEYLKSL